MKKVVIGVILLVGLVVVWSKVSPSREASADKLEDPGGTTEYTENREMSGGLVAGDGEASVAPKNQSLESAKSVDHLSAPVQALLLQDGREHDYNTLMAEIHQLGEDLPAAETAALMDMLASSNDQFPEGMRAIEINAVKNDVLDKLLRQETLPEGLGVQMVEMAADAEADSVWRDYCVQFMDPLYERLTTEYTEENGSDSNSPVNQELDAVRVAMFAALDDRENTLAGTALIGLENLSRTYEEFDKELIAEKAAEMASDELLSNESRLTALRLSAGISNSEQGTRNIEVADAARSVAQTGETKYLRSSAIVTLGEVGSEADRELIESFTADPDRQIAAAAKMALAKMDQRDI